MAEKPRLGQIWSRLGKLWKNMGFSSTFVSDMGSIAALPDWFVEKWQDSIHFHNGNHFPLSSKTFATVHRYWYTLEQDIQKAFAWAENPHTPCVVLVYLHECGGITRVEVHEDAIKYHDPIAWRNAASNAAHDFGDSCQTDIRNALEETE